MYKKNRTKINNQKFSNWHRKNPIRTPLIYCEGQRYTYRVLQTIQTKLILLCVWAEPAVLGSTKTALKIKYEI